MSFVRLCQKLKTAIAPGTRNLRTIQERHYDRVARWTLLLSLVFFNLCYMGYLIYLVEKTSKTDFVIDQLNYIQLSVFCWVVSTVATFILGIAVGFCIYNLKKMFPDQNHAKIYLIAGLFSTAFLIRTAYEWSEFALRNKSDLEVVVQV